MTPLNPKWNVIVTNLDCTIRRNRVWHWVMAWCSNKYRNTLPLESVGPVRSFNVFERSFRNHSIIWCYRNFS